MRIAIHIPKKLPFSIENYINNIMKHLEKGVKFYDFVSVKEAARLKKEVDLFWFPWCAGGASPSLKFYFLLSSKKYIITLHGAAPFVIPSKLYYPSLKKAFKGNINKFFNKIKWLFFYKNNVKKIITVSNYAKQEIKKVFKLPEKKIVVIYHGVNTSIFNTQNSKFGNGNYFLHVSQYQPKKNVERIIKAYEFLQGNKPELILISPGYNGTVYNKKIKIIKTPQTDSELSIYYKNALAFIFPSLHETFGMPILEAMACGCPVITSNTTACAEVAGDSALLVNPYSTEDIVNAMKKIIEDKNLRKTLVKKGLERVKQFSWEKSAKEHLKVFRKVLEE